MELKHAINSRRSIRKYLSDELSEELLRELIDAARRAPSWANRQTTRFIAVRDPDLRTRVQGCVPETNPAYAALGEARLLLVVCGIRGESGFYRGGLGNRLGDYFMFDAGLATQNLMLRARELDLGTCLVGVFDVDELKGILEIPQEAEPIVITPLGRPAGLAAKGPRRKEIDDLLSFDAWKA